MDAWENWRYVSDWVEMCNFCVPRSFNCVAKIMYENVYLPGYVNVEEAVAYFVVRNQQKVLGRTFGFYVLEAKEGNYLQWQEYTKGNPFPDTAVTANYHTEEGNRMFFGHINLQGEDIFGPVFEDERLCYLTRREGKVKTVEDFSILTLNTP